MECAVFHVQSNDTHTLAVLHDQVESKVLNEEIGVVTQRLAVERVQEGMPSTVSGGCATVGLASLSVFQRLSTKGALVDPPPLVYARKARRSFKAAQVKSSQLRLWENDGWEQTSMTV